MPENVDADKPNEPPLEVQRFEFDKAQALLDAEREERHFKAKSKATRWGQLAIFLPLLTGVIGYFVQSAVARHSAELHFIDRQLSELYYPIQFRLKKDDALFVFWQRNQNNKEDERVLNELRQGGLLQNSEQIVSILDQHSDLVRNPDEKTNIQPVMQSMIQYERHAALLSALHAAGDNRTPWEVDHEFGYPGGSFPDEIEKRVRQLEEQRRALSASLF
jgi:hypothetical protein